ncbi:MAG: hypothetical protein ACRYF4_04075 [Janthinobacterium lividum]
MDRVRLGRVLGKGARLAARTAMEAVDAATADAPANGVPTQPGRSASTGNRLRQPEILKPASFPRASASSAARTPSMVIPTTLLPAARAAGAGVLTPFRRASRALWHELTGSFFALFAFSFAVGAWHHRAGAFSTLAADRRRLLVFCLLALLFVYFSVSSFLRARKIETS